MEKQIIKSIIRELQTLAAGISLTRREMTFLANRNYVLAGIRRAGKSCLLYQDIQTQIAN